MSTNALDSGESGWLPITRGILALLAVAIMLTFGTYQIILAPIAETDLIPQRQFRGDGDLSPEVLIHEGNWTVLVVRPSEAQHT